MHRLRAARAKVVLLTTFSLTTLLEPYSPGLLRLVSADEGRLYFIR